MTQSTPWPVDRIAQAIADPASIVGRCFGPSWGAGQVGYMLEQETFARWATRAVVAVIDEFDRDRQAAAPVDRALQLQTEMDAKYFPLDRERVPSDLSEPHIYIVLRDRLLSGVDPITPPKPLADEFPAELGQPLVDAQSFQGAKRSAAELLNRIDADDNEITSAGAR